MSSKTTEEDEAEAEPLSDYESLEAAAVAVLSELGGSFALKAEQRATLKVFLQIFTLLASPPIGSLELLLPASTGRKKKI